MRAIAIGEFGGVEKLRLMDLPAPQAGAGEVLIRVRAAGVNPVDWKIREGLLTRRLPHAFPLIPGWDAAGSVAGRGAGADRFAEGDEVYAYCRKPVVQGGTYAEYVAVPQDSAAHKPRRMSFEEAASVPLAALTAYQSLFDAGRLRAGEVVLVHAAAGGVGTFAVQLAKARGARVIGTASEGNHDYLRSLGCDWPIAYAPGDVRERVRQAEPDGVDVVLDAVGGGTLSASADVLRRGGRLVSLLNPEEVDALRSRGLDAHYVFVTPDHRQLDELTRLLEAGRLRTCVSARFRLEEAATAQAMSQARHTRGKIVLTI